MKKITSTLLLTLLLSVQFFAQDNESFGSKIDGSIKIDFNLNGESTIKDVFFNDSLSGKQDIDIGYTISGEVTSDLTDFLSLGVGFSFQFQRKGDLIIKSDSLKMEEEELTGKKFESGKFGYLPVYAILKINFMESDIISPSIVGQVGYNLFYGDNKFKGDNLLEGGIYYAAGIGLRLFENYQVDFLYQENNGIVSYAENKLFETKYTKLTLSLGINF